MDISLYYPPYTAKRSCFAKLLTVNSCIKVRLDLQADKSSVVVKGPFFPQVRTKGIESVEQCVTQDPI
jgi:hypothetical protein